MLDHQDISTSLPCPNIQTVLICIVKYVIRLWQSILLDIFFKFFPFEIPGTRFFRDIWYRFLVEMSVFSSLSERKLK